MAELCRALAIIKLVEYCILSLPITNQDYLLIHINSDCAAVLSFLPKTMKIIPNSIPLYQIKREILLIKQQYNIIIEPYKVKAYQDEVHP